VATAVRSDGVLMTAEIAASLIGGSIQSTKSITTLEAARQTEGMRGSLLSSRRSSPAPVEVDRLASFAWASTVVQGAFTMQQSRRAT
jgi:hypothetical protein